ncbi:MAG: cardiolipin synthase [Thermoanaerobaculia bacterium]
MPWWAVLVLEIAWVVGVAIWVATDRRAPASTLAWIVALAFLPLVGLPVYWLVGPRRLRRKRVRYQGLADSVKRALSVVERHPEIPPDIARQIRLAARLDEAPLSSALSLTHYRSGKEAFAAIEADLAAATHHIHLEFYIWNDDSTGRRIRDILVARARAGLEVRVLVDSVGASVRSSFFDELVAAGGEFARFNPARFGLRSRLLNFRSHRKIVVVDGKIGFLGGMNVCDEQTVGICDEKPWRDTQLRMEGEAVRWLQRSFFENWQFSKHCEMKAEPAYFPSQERGEHWLQIVHSGPDRADFPIYEFFFTAIAGADERIWITCPYLVPDEATLMAIRSAAHRGVDVRLLVPIRGDSKLVAAAVRSYYDDWLACGARVFEYRPAMLHAKTMVVDHELAVVGSANVDNRSFRLNFEIVAAVYGPLAADRLAGEFEADLQHAREVRPFQLKRRSRRRILAEVGARLFSALL